MSGNIKIKKLYRELYRPLCLYAFRYMKDYVSSEDIVQDCFLSIIEKNLNVANAKSYLFAAVHNKCLNEIRKQSLTGEFRGDIGDSEDSADYMEKAEMEARLWDAIDKLPKKRRTMLLMSKQQGMKNAEIAESLGVSEQTVKNQISRALKSLRKIYGHDGTFKK